MPGPGDFLKVTYKGRNVKRKDKIVYDDSTPYTFLWDSRSYVAEPGKEAFVPYEAVSVAMGDARSGESMASARDEAGNVSWVTDRPTELRRLRILYDNEVDDSGLPLYAPEATVTDLEGNDVKMVLHDPSGASVIPVSTTALDRDQLMAQIQRQQRMIQQLAQDQGIDLPPDEPAESQTLDEPSDQSTANPFETIPEG